jgi:hypothetical protein
MLDNDKHSSLFCRIIEGNKYVLFHSYLAFSEKTGVGLSRTACCQRYKTFFLLIMKMQNKLERFSLASLSSLV